MLLITLVEAGLSFTVARMQAAVPKQTRKLDHHACESKKLFRPHDKVVVATSF
jgi:hypothetical protein